MVAMNNRLSTSETNYDMDVIAQGTRADISEIEDRMTQALVVYSQQQRSGTGKDSTSMCERLQQ